MTRFDAIVIGAGPAGATAALALARQGRSVALVEKASFPRYKVCGEFVSRAAWSVLASLGVGDALRAVAGPAVRTVGLWHGDDVLQTSVGDQALGRAIGRHVLDATLAAAARNAGATRFHPARASSLERAGDAWCVGVEMEGGFATLEAPVVIAAHGSWETGPLPTQRAGPPKRPLLGFKARFANARLREGHMPLVIFPGGYGGLVHTDGGAVSFSLCIRAGVLAACRKEFPGHSAGEAAFLHVCRHVRGVREALGSATPERAWMGAGPIRPGLRELASDGLFRAGNAAGEAHPLVAEGIGMAIESGALVAAALRGWDGSAASLAAVERDYRWRWRRAIASRIVASMALERLTATAPRLVTHAARTRPGLFALAARWSGKGRKNGDRPQLQR